jgi:hypothetical protein
VGPHAGSETDGRTAQHEGDCRCAPEEDGRGEDGTDGSANGGVVVCADLADVVPLRRGSAL